MITVHHHRTIFWAGSQEAQGTRWYVWGQILHQVWLTEGDGQLPPSSLLALLAHYQQHVVMCGRHGRIWNTAAAAAATAGHATRLRRSPRAGRGRTNNAMSLAGRTVGRGLRLVSTVGFPSSADTDSWYGPCFLGPRKKIRNWSEPIGCGGRVSRLRDVCGVLSRGRPEVPTVVDATGRSRGRGSCSFRVRGSSCRSGTRTRTLAARAQRRYCCRSARPYRGAGVGWASAAAAARRGATGRETAAHSCVAVAVAAARRAEGRGARATDRQSSGLNGIGRNHHTREKRRRRLRPYEKGCPGGGAQTLSPRRPAGGATVGPVVRFYFLSRFLTLSLNSERDEGHTGFT